MLLLRATLQMIVGLGMWTRVLRCVTEARREWVASETSRDFGLGVTQISFFDHPERPYPYLFNTSNQKLKQLSLQDLRDVNAFQKS